MVGGTVVETITEDSRIFLHVKDKTYPKDRCGIFVARDADSEKITIGDNVWWQGKFIYWTPTGDDVVDYPLRRVSFSGVNHPWGKDVLDHPEIRIEE